MPLSQPGATSLGLGDQSEFGAESAKSALREISCDFVDRILRIRSNANHETTLSFTKENGITNFCLRLPGALLHGYESERALP